MAKLTADIDAFGYPVDAETFVADVLRRVHAVVGDLEGDRLFKVIKGWRDAINPSTRKEPIASIRRWSEKYLTETMSEQKAAAAAKEKKHER